MRHDHDFSRHLIQKRPGNRVPQLLAEYAQTTELGGKFAIIECANPASFNPNRISGLKLTIDPDTTGTRRGMDFVTWRLKCPVPAQSATPNRPPPLDSAGWLNGGCGAIASRTVAGKGSRWSCRKQKTSHIGHSDMAFRWPQSDRHVGHEAGNEPRDSRALQANFYLRAGH